MTCSRATLILLGASILTALASCRKDTPDDPVSPGPNPGLVSVQAEYYPFEVALYEMQGVSAPDGNYPGTFNGQAMDVRVTGNMVSFLVPGVGPGTYGFAVTLGAAGPFDLTCTVRAAPALLPADQYVSQVVSRLSQTSAALDVLLDSLGGIPEAALIAQDHARFQAFADSVQDVVASATDADRLEFARIMAANEHYIIDLHNEVTQLLEAVSATHRLVIDRESEWRVAASLFVTATQRVVARTLPVAASLYLAFTASSTGIGVGIGVVGLLGAALLVDDLMDAAQAAAAAGKRLLDISIISHSELTADANQFQSGQDALIVLEASYRTVYLGDATTPTSNFIQRFVSAYQQFRQRLTDFVGSLPSAFRPNFSLSELSEAFSTAVRRVHTNWLQVAGSTSSSDVTVQKVANADGSTALRFTNTASAPRTVTYSVTYSHPDLVTRTTTLSATVAAGSGGACAGTTVTDIDGNVYPVVTIGSQCWMAANLKTTRYNDGSTIPNVTDNTAWTQLNSGAWCFYDNDPTNDAIYGKLYNWYAAANPNICPQGWHVPTDAEWQQLEAALGMPAGELGITSWYRGEAQNVGGKMKTITLWDAPNIGATNESGFSGLPGGGRQSENGDFTERGSDGSWWSTSESGAEYAWYRGLWMEAGIGRDYDFKRFGSCLRCLRD